MSRSRIACCFVTVCASTLASTALAEDRAGLEFFESRIRPVLVQHCYECHSAESKTPQGGLRVDSRDALRKGGDSGPAVTPNAIDDSLLISALEYDGLEMPPKGRLSAEVIADFRKWIEMGAPDPRTQEAAPAAAEIDFDEWSTFWSFQPPRKTPLPPVRNQAWPKNEIDHFVLARLEQESLHPVAAADRRTLIRRASFDLLGLPPTPEEVAAFVADDSPDAYRRLIDRLLESPHYGERWGRHWLDVARFAEDQAHTFAVKPNTEAWRYRQWVIDSLNADLPYDQFVRLQIAGDQLDESLGYDRFVALGYFGLGAVYYKNSDKAKAEADELDDRIDTLTRGFLGLTVSCARCHDHKFDPIPTGDYYSLAGIFNSSPLTAAPLVEPDVVAAYDQGQRDLKEAEKQLTDRTRELRESLAERSTDQIARYLLAAWKKRVAQARNASLSTKELAKEHQLNETTLRKWIEFLGNGKRGKHAALEAWYALADPTSETPLDDPGDAVTEAANALQEYVAGILDERDGKTRNVARPESAKASDAVYTSPVVTRDNPAVQIDVELAGARELYLVITDAGDGKSCDHADWISPRLQTASGEIQLTERKWRFAKTGYGSVNLNRGVEGGPLRIGDQTYKNGIGTHAPCVIAYDLPEGVERFQATAGLDVTGTGQGSGATVKFLIFTSAPPDALTAETDASEPARPGTRSLSKDKTELLKDLFGESGVFALPDDQFQATLAPEDLHELDALKSRHQAAKTAAPAMYPVAHAIHDREPKDMPVFVRGNPARPGDVAPRQFLRILAGPDRSAYTSGSGRRELADDIASEHNPLTPRVIVNRVWQHHFGRGIVGTPSNFGFLGERPTHPELLDWLTTDFIEQGWSLKHLHRTILLSATYQLSSDHDDKNAEIDGDSRWLWRMNRRRLDVEAWRDALLSVSGNLDPTVGGENAPLNGRRRTVYARVSRHELDELLRLFDFPDANVTSEARTVTTVPQQQLFVLNSEFVIQQAKSLAQRVQDEAVDDDQRIRRAFQLLFARDPSAEERQVGLDFLASANADAAEQKLTPWQQYAQALLSLNEFMYVD